MGISKATYKIVYEGKDITRDLEGEVISLSYRDKTIGEADEISLVLKDELHKWKSSWNPQKGDKLEANIITGDQLLRCGEFSIDEVDFLGSAEGGDTVSIKALSAGVRTSVRTKSSFAHEGKTLKQVAQKIADKYNYRVQGIIHNYSIGRITQFHETDLGFLHRIAEEYGYVFSLRGNILVFTYLPDLCNTKAAIDVDFADAKLNYQIRDKVAGIYVRGQYRYHNRKEKKLYDGLVNAGANPSADVFRSVDHIDNDEHGLYKVDGRMYKKNMEQVEINCTVPGNVILVSGINVNMTNWFNYSGKFFLSESSHIVDGNNNYVTGCQFKKIVPNQKTGNKAGEKVGYTAE